MKQEEKDRNQPDTKLAPLAIIGIGCLFPKSEDKTAYWANIREGVDAITEIPESHWRISDHYDSDPKRADHTYGKRGGFLSEVPFNPMEFNIPPNAIEAIDTSQLLGLVAAGQALKDAGYGSDKVYDRSKVSVILGVTGALEMVIPLGARLGYPRWREALKDAGVTSDVAEDVVQRISDSYVSWQENSFPGLLGNVVAGRISKHYDLGGTNCVVDAACASSFSALHLAGMELMTGAADMVVTGGVDTFNDIFMYTCFSKTPALSPTSDAKPFDISADGTILGEGIGIVVIKRLADAERDNDPIYAVITGIGSSSDGKGEAIYTPSATGQKNAITNACNNAGVTPKEITLLEAHGTGTKVGDAVEISAAREIYGKAETPWCAISSVKSQIGHTKAAAGAAGLIKAALALHYRVIPPTIKVNRPADEIISSGTPFYITTCKRPWITRNNIPRRAAVSAFGFGGSNFHTILEEYRPLKEAADWDNSVQILAFSAENQSTLEQQLKTVPSNLSWSELRGKAAELRKVFDIKANCRLTIVLERDKSALASVLKNSIAMLLKQPDSSWSTPDGIYYSVGLQKGKLALLFPGQGAQYTGMLRDIACAFPQFIQVLEKAEENIDISIADSIYPPTPFTTEALEQQESTLRATETAQPAIGTVSLGTLRVMESFGLKSDAAAGHSYGELTALCASGILDESSFLMLSHLRGRLMADGKGDKGSMLAVSAPISAVEEMLAEEKINLIIANRNAPNQVVLSGTIDEIIRALEICEKRKLACKQLQVAAAFHSPLVSDASTPFLAAMSEMHLNKGEIPVYANSTGEAYPADEQATKELLAGQLARPVEFVSEIETMYAEGIRTFVEVGPGARLCGLVKAILADREYTTVAIDSSNGKRSGIVDLARALSQLAALAYPINLAIWDEGYKAPVVSAKKPLLTVPLSGANYVKPKAKRPPVEHKAETATVNNPEIKHEETGMRTQEFNQPSISNYALAESLRVAREGMAALQKMQEDTAQLHRRFLEGQETASRTIQALLSQQQLLLNGQGQTSTVITQEHQRIELPVRQDTKLSLQESVVRDEEVSKVSAPVPSALSTLDQVTESAVLSDNITETLFAVVSEKTGYPVEMLEPGMSMDADLGIDSIKRVEILSALQEKLPSSPVIGPEQMGVLNTLGQIAGFLGQGSTERGQERSKPSVSPAALNLPTAALVTETLFAVVSEKTGYPVEMLEPGMSMDADLGIDSIKRVEILSALQEKLPSSPVIGPEQMGVLNTLGQIAGFLGQGSTERGQERSKPSVSPAASNLPTAALVTETLFAVVSEKTGYPVEMLEPEMSMDADLGIDSIKRVEILSALQEKLPSSPVIGPEQMGVLNTLGQIAGFLTVSSSTSDKVAAAKETAETFIQSSDSSSLLNRSAISVNPLPLTSEKTRLAPDGLIVVTDDGSAFSAELCSRLTAAGHGVILTRVMDILELLPVDQINGLVITAPAEGTDDSFLNNAFQLLKQVASGLKRAAQEGGAIFATVSRLDGSFGFGTGTNIVDPLSGGLAGMTKTARHEWPGVICKSIDLGIYKDTADEAKAVADELLQAGPIEVGLSPAARVGLTLTDLPELSPISESVINEGDLVIITGGGRGVTAAASVALAKAWRPLLVMLGRSPQPESEPSWLIPLTDEAKIKRAILEHSREKLHPKTIEERYQATIAGRELRETISKIEAAGGKAIYRSVDIRDSQAVAELINSLRNEFGSIRGIVHGAGVLADRLIVDKTREQFSQVYSTKVVGLRSMLEALKGDELRFIALFGSTTGRLGRSGQIDYAVANEVLNKLAQTEARRVPGCRTVCINWGPWDGGMVTSALKKLFSNEGIGLIPLEVGGELLVHELAQPGGSVEVTVLAGISGSSLAADIPTKQASPLKEALHLTLTVDDFPFIRSHVIDGKAVLPMAMMVEWLASGALHGNPGFRFHGFNDLRICKGVIIDQSNPCALQLMAGKAQRQDAFYVVPVELTSHTTEGQRMLHARAEIVLANRLPEGIRSITDLPSTPYRQTETGIYEQPYLFHGPDLHGIEQITSCSGKGIAAVVKAAPQPANWIRQPLRSNWLTDPLVLDSAFQMMILWSFERFGAGSLPSFAGRYRQFHETFPRDGAQVVVRITAEQSHSAIADIEFLDRNNSKLIARLEGYECVIDASLEKAFKRNSLMQQGKAKLEAA